MITKILITGLFVLLTVQVCYSQRATAVKNPYEINNQDTTQKILPATDVLEVEVRLLDENKIDKYKNDPDFKYDSNQPEAEDWITKIKNWINQQLSNIVSSETYSTILDYIYYGLMIIALILIIRGLLKADRRGLIFGKINTQALKTIESQENLSELNFDDLIISAIETKNYKLAIRYLYLKSLHSLANQGFIELRDNKTNYQYLSEIKNSQIAAAFHNTTRLFEWAWYGEFPIDENLLKSSQNKFKELFGLITIK
jgi:hypothetical protein